MVYVAEHGKLCDLLSYLLYIIHVSNERLHCMYIFDHIARFVGMLSPIYLTSGRTLYYEEVFQYKKKKKKIPAINVRP